MKLNRRAFLKTTAAAGAAAYLSGDALAQSSMNVKIQSIQTFPLIYPTIGRFKFFEGPKGRPSGRPAVLVKITADNGKVGWGQSVPVPKWSYETLESVCTTIEKYLAPELLGLNPADSNAIHAVMQEVIAPSFSTGQPICKAGIDLALADLNGKILQQNAAHSWKQKGRSKITLSWTLNPRTLDEIEGLIEQGTARGYKHFNVKVAPDPKFDLEMCRIVKRLVPNGFLWADANGGYDVATALEVAPKLADIGVPVLEQPIPANRLTGYQQLKKQGALPIIMDEGVVSSVELEEFIKLGLLDGVAMKPARCGGLTEARRQVEMIKNAGMMFLGSGLTDPDFALAATLILYGAYDLKYPAALNGPQFIDATVLKQPFKVENGELPVPTGFGLGVEIDEKNIEPLLVKI
ncbi:MAG: twin-arginine translocation signal domain-containing protein [Verrucomicrobia bacterium]|nr:twin-arginine translocation signal domain-containing protein [Verrucomicrobiota bacterium]